MAKRKLKLNKILPLLVAAMFLGSILVLFGSSGRGSKSVNIEVDMGAYGLRPYKGQVSVIEGDTALDVLSQYTGNLKMEDGKIRCIGDYCNNNATVWNSYFMDENVLKRIDGKLEDHLVENGDRLIFRYELKTE